MVKICFSARSNQSERVSLLNRCLNLERSAPVSKRLITAALAAILAITLLIVAGLLFAGVILCPAPLIAAALFFGGGMFFLGSAFIGGMLTLETAARERLHRSQILAWNNLCCKTAKEGAKKQKQPEAL
ncbi:inclusion membrane protein IncD [Chlamydia suis]|uniref:Inclusion membrane protein-15 n=1 Tax=Chlamydia suis TaxID=83559 RepID=A0ABX6ITC5_9CHLA|nr:inclusion membrane protein IncD [Chlamydia suis]QHP83292.1 Inclusion membrane protein-15 [Chlamydia suis]QYC71423.1 inclusion membrane protein IncD [Chlamydia suis]QYC72318.1 inclusion membrane protein IncD [Chlamydia suis]QYC73214.1 inclusion membrane protein IncD [Chlamydia suis]QYC78651.1 inclusion membrane protein IncD [Chlamydia suis]